MNHSTSLSDCIPELRFPFYVPCKPAGPERAAEILAELKTLCRNLLGCNYIFPEIKFLVFEQALDRYLKKLKSARKTTLFEGCALAAVAVESKKQGYSLTLSTAFDPWPRYVEQIGESYAEADSMRPLGMYENYDLYVTRQAGVPILAARFGSGKDVLTHDLDLLGPPTDAPPASIREAYRRYEMVSFSVKADGAV